MDRAIIFFLLNKLCEDLKQAAKECNSSLNKYNFNNYIFTGDCRGQKA